MRESLISMGSCESHEQQHYLTQKNHSGFVKLQTMPSGGLKGYRLWSYCNESGREASCHRQSSHAFGIFNHLFKCDWLHCADQGVAADFLGNLFAYLVDKKMPGDTIRDRSVALGALMQPYYKENNVLDTLREFLPKTYHSEKKTTRPPRLKGNAACTRALVPFGRLMANKFLADDVPLEAAMKAAARHLNNCYDSLRESSKPFCHDALYHSAKHFAIQYDALHEACGSGVPWRPMPKMHMFLELCSAGTEPQKFWNHRDEDFGGTVAKQSKMKGMWKKLAAFAAHGLDMFKMKNLAPRIMEHTK